MQHKYTTANNCNVNIQITKTTRILSPLRLSARKHRGLILKLLNRHRTTGAAMAFVKNGHECKEWKTNVVFMLKVTSRCVTLFIGMLRSCWVADKRRRCWTSGRSIVFWGGRNSWKDCRSASSTHTQSIRHYKIWSNAIFCRGSLAPLGNLKNMPKCQPVKYLHIKYTGQDFWKIRNNSINNLFLSIAIDFRGAFSYNALSFLRTLGKRSRETSYLFQRFSFMMHERSVVPFQLCC